MFNTARLLCSLLFVGLLILGQASHSPAASLTQSGVGGGGFLQSGAFDPTDTNVVVIGGDNCGVYRSDNYGETWTLWNEGLTNPDEVESDMVEDLLGVSYLSTHGYFAATRAGIFFRDDTGPWEWQTPSTDPGYTFDRGDGEYPLPFSSFDQANFYVFAGAGHGRFLWPDVDIPETENSLIWSYNLFSSENGWTPWGEDIPTFTSGAPRSVRDISAALLPNYLVIAAATPDGIWLYWQDSTGSGWIKIESETDCWSVHLTERGTLYAAFSFGANTKRGVHRIADVQSELASMPAQWSWEAVDVACDSTDCGPPLACQSVSETSRLALLTVLDGSGTEDDILYLTGAPNPVIERGGLYRSELDGTAAIPSGFSWKHWAYVEFVPVGTSPWQNFYFSKATGQGPGTCPNYPGNNGQQEVFESGWHREKDLSSLLRPIVSPTNRNKVLMQSQGRLHRYHEIDDVWEQVFTLTDGGLRRVGDPVSCSEGQLPMFWKTTGYNQHAVRDIAIRTDSFGVRQAMWISADYGLFRSNANDKDTFHRLNPDLVNGGGTGALPFPPATWQARHVQYEPVEDATYVVYRGILTPGRVYKHTPPCTWEHVTDGVPAALTAQTGVTVDSERISYKDLAVVDSVLYVAYSVYADTLGEITATDTLTTLRGVVRGVNSGGWTWTDVSTGLDSGTTFGTFGYDLMYNKKSGYVFLAGQFHKKVGAGKVPVAGGLFYLDHDGGGTSWTRIFGNGTTQPVQKLENFLSLGQSKGQGNVLYAGTGGRQGHRGGVVKCNQTNGDPANPASWTWITPNAPFGFEIPLHAQGTWSDSVANDYLTEVTALAVSPFNDHVLFAGLSSYRGSFSKEGVWAYNLNGPSWDEYPAGDPTELAGVEALAFMGAGNTRDLFIGTQGHGVYRTTVTKPGPGGPGTGCPFVYVYDGNEFVEDNTILTQVSATAAGLASSNVIDRYVLQEPLVAVDGRYRLQIREFENEHSYIDRVQLLSVKHPKDSQLAVLDNGEVVAHHGWTAPISVTGPDGADLLEDLSKEDQVGFSGKKGDEVDITYRLPDREGLVVIMSTDPKEPLEPESIGGPHGIEVLVLDDSMEDFAFMGSIQPRERQAPRGLSIPAGIQESLEGGNELRIRLVWHSDHNLDYIGLVNRADVEMEEVPLRLVTGVHSRVGATEAAVKAADGAFAELKPGEALDLAFDAEPSGKIGRSFVLVTEGHYTRVDPSAILKFRVMANAPNPFQAKTAIRFELPDPSSVSIEVFSVSGRRVRTLVDREFPAGRHEVVWDGMNGEGRQLASGVYFYRVVSDFGTETRKMVLVQ